jgi:RNA polymerase sigma-70 factor (ECF subfamily)
MPLMDGLDAEVVERAAQGDAEAFRMLTIRYYRPVGGFVLKRIGRSDMVEDLVQETFLEAWRTLKAGKRPEHFSSWLFGVAHNLCGKWLRRKRPRLFSPDEAPDLVATPSEAEMMEEVEEQTKRLARLEKGLAELPEETRRLVEMKHRGNRTCEQIAKETGKPVGTVKSLLARTYKLLRERLGTGEGGVS